MVRDGLASKGVTVVPEVDERICRRTVDLSRKHCDCLRWLEWGMACKHAHAIADATGASHYHEAWLKVAAKPQYWVSSWTHALGDKQFPMCLQGTDCVRAEWVIAPASTQVSCWKGRHSEQLHGRDAAGKKPSAGQLLQRDELAALDATAIVKRALRN